MTTDFGYDNKTINSTGPVKPSGINQPLDPRTEVKIYADIESIPNPYVGMIITVLQDETNSNKMTDYKVLSLKANSLGVANSVVDQVQRYVDYLRANGQSVDTDNFATKEELGLKADKTELHSHINKTVLDGITSANVNNWNNKVDKVEGKTLTTNDYTNEEKQTVASLKATVGDTSSGLVKDVKDLKTNGVSQDNINTAIENYLTEHPISSGATAEQAAQIEANRTAIGDENSGLIKEVNDLTESLSNVDAVSLNGKSFSEPMTKAEYDALLDKDSNTIYLVDDDTTITGVPDYSTNDAGKVLAVNNDGTALAWMKLPNNTSDTLIFEDVSNDEVFMIIEATLSSISAVYTQGDTIVYPNTSLDNLKSNLVVTATYSDNNTNTITDYVLSGTLTVGTSTITVTYNGKTTTFDVTVSEESENTITIGTVEERYINGNRYIGFNWKFEKSNEGDKNIALFKKSDESANFSSYRFNSSLDKLFDFSDKDFVKINNCYFCDEPNNYNSTFMNETKTPNESYIYRNSTSLYVKVRTENISDISFEQYALNTFGKIYIKDTNMQEWTLDPSTIISYTATPYTSDNMLEYSLYNITINDSDSIVETTKKGLNSFGYFNVDLPVYPHDTQPVARKVSNNFVISLPNSANINSLEDLRSYFTTNIFKSYTLK